MYADLEVDDEYSIALPRYKTHWTGTQARWNRNWEYEFHLTSADWDITDTRFVPVDVMAYYWFRRYVGFPDEGARTLYARYDTTRQPPIRLEPNKIRGVQLLGPVAHAGGDVTVPQHTVGSSGIGHQPYEDDFQAQYQAGNIRMTPGGVASHLRDRDFLTTGTSAVSDQIDSLQVTVVTGSGAAWSQGR